MSASERARRPFSGSARESLADGAGASPVALWAPVAEHLAEQDAEEVAIAARRLPEQELVRRQKLDEMRERGFDPYAVDFQRDDMIGPIRERFQDLEADARTGEPTGVLKDAAQDLVERAVPEKTFDEKHAAARESVTRSFYHSAWAPATRGGQKQEQAFLFQSGCFCGMIIPFCPHRHMDFPNSGRTGNEAFP